MAIYTPTYTFSNGTTADGGQVQTEMSALGSSVNNIVNAQIRSDAAIDISKTTLGTYTPWTDYTPTISVSGGTAPTYTANFKSRYTQIGKLVTVMLFWTNSSGGTAGAGANPILITTPVNIAVSDGRIMGSGASYESGGTIVPVLALNYTATTFGMAVSSTFAPITGNDQSSVARQINLILSYEAA